MQKGLKVELFSEVIHFEISVSPSAKRSDFNKVLSLERRERALQPKRLCTIEI